MGNPAKQVLLRTVLCMGVGVGLSMGAGTSWAHMVLEQASAIGGQSYKAVFKVSHGCAGSATREIVVHLPTGVSGAKPMPKAGWRLHVQHEKLAQPETRHGHSISEDVSRITWSAKTSDDMLPSGHYDEFVLVATLPAHAGMLYWPVEQVCVQGRNDWVQVPQTGQKTSELKAPAAVLEVRTPTTTGGHVH